MPHTYPAVQRQNFISKKQKELAMRMQALFVLSIFISNYTGYILNYKFHIKLGALSKTKIHNHIAIVTILRYN